MLHIERVAGARVIEVEATVLRPQTVIRDVVDAAKAQRRAHLVAFAGVVVDNVKDHFEACRMQRLHHGLELANVACRGIACFGREEADGVVAPVIAQPQLHQAPIVDEFVDRHQLDRRDAKPLEIFDHRRGCKSGIGTTQCRRHIGMLHGEATHVQLIDHHLVPGHVGTAIIAPSKGGIDHLALEHAARAVTPVERQILALVADGVAKQRIAPAQAADHVHCIRVEQQLVGIEAMAFVGSVWAVHAVAIEHAGPRFVLNAIKEGAQDLDAVARSIVEEAYQKGSADNLTLQIVRIDELPDEFQDVRTEIHDPGKREALAYLATTRRGRRIYLNRTVVDADQSIVVAGCRKRRRSAHSARPTGHSRSSCW